MSLEVDGGEVVVSPCWFAFDGREGEGGERREAEGSEDRGGE